MTSVRERRLPEPAAPTAPVAPGLGAAIGAYQDAVNFSTAATLSSGSSSP